MTKYENSIVYRWKYWIWLIAVIGIVTSCTMEPDQPISSEKVSAKNVIIQDQLQVHFIDVGQADSILLQNEEAAMLIDAGNNADERLVVEYLQSQGIKRLDYVIGTHPHEDHIGGLDAVIRSFEIGKVYMPRVTHNTATFQDVIKAVEDKGLKITAPKVGETFGLGDAVGMMIGPGSETYKNLNDYSIVIKIVYGETSFLFTGDAEEYAEEEMIKSGLDLSADVLKVGHHGSRSSSTDPFLKQVSPHMAVIMAGEGNDYGHPHPETIEKLAKQDIKVYRTDLHGTVKAISDGKSIVFQTEKEAEVQNTSQTDWNKETVYKDEKGQGLIKGNINSRGEKIYHMPGGAYYERTNPEEWFQTETEAQNAGYRKSQR